MWKKSESENPPVEKTPPARPSPRQPAREPSMLGPSLIVKGDLTGEENLMVEGKVEGKIELKQNNVTVGRNGQVKADIYGRTINIEGEVHGNLYGEEKIIVHESGNVRGNISSPRVTLEDGARFKGSIDMDSKETLKQGSFKEMASEKPAAKEATRENESEGSSSQDDKPKQPDKLGLGIKVKQPSSKT